MREIKDAIVAFEVKDKDLFRTRFMAEAFLAFSEIPETASGRDLESLEQIHLKLSRPTAGNRKFHLFLQTSSMDTIAELFTECYSFRRFGSDSHA